MILTDLRKLLPDSELAELDGSSCAAPFCPDIDAGGERQAGLWQRERQLSQLAEMVPMLLGAIVANARACQRSLSTDPPNFDCARTASERTVRDANSASDVINGVCALFKHSSSDRPAANIKPHVAEPSRGGLAPWQAKRACERLDSDLGGKLSLEQIAAEFGLSVSHFSRAFRASTGLPPHQWLLRQRVKTAKQLMTIRDLPLSEIAISAGFANQSHFTRVFSTVVGVSPGAWRREVPGKRKATAKPVSSSDPRRLASETVKAARRSAKVSFGA
jgi:AraC-like DNA-binding protein